MARVILHKKNVPHKFWIEGVNIACCIANQVYLRVGTKQIPYELWKGKKPNVNIFEYLRANAISWGIKSNWANLIPEAIKEYFLGILLIVELIVCITCLLL